MANVMSMTHLKNHTSRSGFDLSRKNAFTAKVGELLPVMVEECIPGDKFNIKPEWFTRTMPVNTAAYTRIKEYYDFYFVPNRLLWKYFPQFVTQMDNPESSVSPTVTGSGNSFTESPYISQEAVQAIVNFTYARQSTYLDIFGRPIYGGIQKLLNYLDYGFYDTYEGSLKKSNLKLNPLPLLAYQKIYYDWYRNSQWENMSPATWNVDFYGYAPYKNKDLFTCYNGTASGIQPNLLGMFTLRYANWHKDLFMGVLPRPQYGDESFAPLNIDPAPFSDDSSTASATEYTPLYSPRASVIQVGSQLHASTDSGGMVSEPLAHYHEVYGSVDDISGSLSVLALRQAQALQKWKEISLAHNKNYKDQVQAHFGTKVSDILSNRSTFIGGTSNVVSIGEVVNSNLTGDASASIGGKGTGNGSGKIDFDVKEHGILMCIYHAEPLLDYQSRAVSPLSLKLSPTDYAIPELDRIGMQRVPSLFLVDRKTNLDDENAFYTGTLGYAPRYWDYKTKVDQLHGGFTNGDPYGSSASSFYQWVAPRSQDDLTSFLNDYNLSNYVFFKINPSVLNSIFVSSVDSTLTTDQLLVNANFDVKAVRNLDYDGLPY